jgi:hypothetical protein
VLVSEYNSLGDGRYYDVETQSSFDFDHATGKASAVQSFVLESQQEDLVYVHARRCTTRRRADTLVLTVMLQKEPRQVPQHTRLGTLPQVLVRRLPHLRRLRARHCNCRK